MTQISVEGLVSPSDIAELTGYTRGAVSNWRRRADDFPDVVAGTAANPLFRRDDVLAWLEANDKPIKQDRGENAAWAALNVLRGELDMSEAATLIVTLACARKLAEQRGPLSALQRWNEAQATGHSADTSALLLSAFRDLDDHRALLPFDRRHAFLPQAGVGKIIEALGSIQVPDLPHATDVVLERLSRSQGKMGAEFGFAGSRTSALLASLCAGADGGTLYDPACGIGVALLQVVDSGVAPLRIVGHDINQDVLRLARQRAYLRDTEIEFALGDVLERDLSPELWADVIVAEPPWGMSLRAPMSLADTRFRYGQPPKSSGDWAWVQHVVEHLSDSGRGYVVLTAGGLDRVIERSIRMGLVGAGCVEAVVGLPGKMLPHVSIPLALLVLRRPSADGAAADVLFIDAANVGEPEHDVARWLSDPESLQDVPHMTVGIADVLAKDARLDPRAWVPANGPDPDLIARLFTDGLNEVLSAARAIGERASLPAARAFTRARIATVDELASQGVLKIWGSGRPEERYADMGYPKALLERVVSASDVRDGTLRSVSMTIEPGDDLDRAYLTGPGDLLVTTWNGLRARVDVVGSHLPGTGVHRLKIGDPSMLEPDYLAMALTGSWNKRFLGGTTIQRAKLGDLEVPLVPIDEQRRMVTDLREIDDIDHLAARLSAGTADLRDAYLDALRYNIDLTSTNTEGTAE